jgi:hypothetical protein
VATPAQLFANLAGDDHHLYPGSPAIDAGEARADVPTDLEDTPRPLGSGWDIGAYEAGLAIFSDGFETNNTDRWSDAIP